MPNPILNLSLLIDPESTDRYRGGVPTGEPVLSRRQEYAEATHNAVLHAAETLLARAASSGGRLDAAVEEVAVLARVSKGTVYHHFADKAALFETVYRRQLTWLAAAMSGASARHSEPWRQLWACLKAYLEAGEGGGTPLAGLGGELVGSERARKVEEEVLMPPLRHVVERLTSAHQLATSDPELATRLILGVGREGRAVASNAHNAVPEAQVQRLVQAMVRGLKRARSD